MDREARLLIPTNVPHRQGLPPQPFSPASCRRPHIFSAVVMVNNVTLRIDVDRHPLLMGVGWESSYYLTCSAYYSPSFRVNIRQTSVKFPLIGNLLCRLLEKRDVTRFYLQPSDCFILSVFSFSAKEMRGENQWKTVFQKIPPTKIRRDARSRLLSDEKCVQGSSDCMWVGGEAGLTTPRSDQRQEPENWPVVITLGFAFGCAE